MKTVSEKIIDHLRAEFSNELPKALTKAFGDLRFKTEFNIFVSAFGDLVTNWSKEVTPQKCKEIQKFIQAYEGGYYDALDLISSFKK